jgi:hypothetical protein
LVLFVSKEVTYTGHAPRPADWSCSTSLGVPGGYLLKYLLRDDFGMHVTLHALQINQIPHCNNNNVSFERGAWADRVEKVQQCKMSLIIHSTDLRSTARYSVARRHYCYLFVIYVKPIGTVIRPIVKSPHFSASTIISQAAQKTRDCGSSVL